jgi:hypothetical protein
MDISKSFETRIDLPAELYQEIEQRALARGCSVNGEIVTLLAYSRQSNNEWF